MSPALHKLADQRCNFVVLRELRLGDEKANEGHRASADEVEAAQLDRLIHARFVVFRRAHFRHMGAVPQKETDTDQHNAGCDRHKAVDQCLLVLVHALTNIRPDRHLLEVPHFGIHDGGGMVSSCAGDPVLHQLHQSAGVQES